jgi:hypothetical protein
MWSAIGAIAIAGCADTRTDRPVVSDTEAGRSVSPAGDSAAARGMSMVRVVNAAGVEKSFTVTADGQPLFPSVAPKGVTEYTEVHDNVVNFDLRESPGDSSVADNSEVMRDGVRYTVVALPKEDAGYALRVLRDELVPATGKARVRLINAAPRTEDVDLALVGVTDPIVDDVRFGTEAGFKDVDPTGSSALELRVGGKPARAGALTNVQLAAGRAYTVILVRNAKGQLETITFDDTASPRPAGS